LQDWALPANQAESVVVKYKITDITPAFPAGHTGNIIDSPITGLWNIQYDNGIDPTTIINLAPPNPADNTWYPALSVHYKYAVGPDLKGDKISDYQGKIINEDLTGPFDGGVFTLTDIKDQFKADNPASITIDDFVRKIFVPPFGENHAWNINSGVYHLALAHQDKFNGTDSHGGMTAPAVNNVIAAFKNSAAKAGNIGYKINQSYKCNGHIIGTTELYKRLILDSVTGDLLDQFKKNHNF
jgi:hypothetical protein